jgi:hypothetical protein
MICTSWKCRFRSKFLYFQFHHVSVAKRKGAMRLSAVVFGRTQQLVPLYRDAARCRPRAPRNDYSHPTRYRPTCVPDPWYGTTDIRLLQNLQPCGSPGNKLSPHYTFNHEKKRTLSGPWRTRAFRWFRAPSRFPGEPSQESFVREQHPSSRCTLGHRACWPVQRDARISP